MRYAVKANVLDLSASVFRFDSAKTMYGGKGIARGDTVFVFDSEHRGGTGLIAKGVVVTAELVPRERAGGRETPRVSVCVGSLVRWKRPLGRDQVKRFTDWKDGRAETEVNFKFYRQATNKIVGLSDETAEFLEGFF